MSKCSIYCPKRLFQKNYLEILMNRTLCKHRYCDIFIATGKKQQQRLSRELFAFSAAQNQFTDDKVSNFIFLSSFEWRRDFFTLKTCEESSSVRLSGLFTQTQKSCLVCLPLSKRRESGNCRQSANNVSSKKSIN